MTTTRENVIEFNGQSGVNISFEFDNDYVVTKGQTLEKVDSSGNCKVTIHAGRKGSKKCAKWFSEYVGGDDKK